MTRKKTTQTTKDNIKKNGGEFITLYEGQQKEDDGVSDLKLLYPVTNKEKEASNKKADDIANMVHEVLNGKLLEANIEPGEIKEVLEKSTSFLKSKLKEAGNGAKFLMAMGGIAPQLIKGADGNIDPKGLMIDVGETLAISAVQVLPGAGPILSGILSVVFQFLNSPKQQNEFALLSKQLEDYVDDKIRSAELEILQGMSNSIQENFKDFSLTLLNLVSAPSKSDNVSDEYITAVNELVTKKDIIFAQDIAGCLTLSGASWSGIGYYSLMSKVKLATLMALADCDVFKKNADEATIKTLYDEMDMLVSDTNDRIIFRAQDLFNVGKHKWSDKHQGFTLCYTQGLVLWLNEVNIYIHVRHKISLGNRLTCELFSPYCKDIDYDDKNIFTLTKNGFYLRSTPPVQIQAQWLHDNLLGLEMGHSQIDSDGVSHSGGLVDNVVDWSMPNPINTITKGGGILNYGDTIPFIVENKVFKINKNHHGINLRVSSSGARGICQFDISDKPAQLFETKDGAVTKSFNIEPDSMFSKRDKYFEAGAIQHLKYDADPGWGDYPAYFTNQDEMRNVMLFAGNADSGDKNSSSKSGNGITSFFLAGMYRGALKFDVDGMSAQEMIKQDKGANVGGFVIRHNSSYDYKAVIDGRKKIIELDACCGLINLKSDGADFDHNDPLTGYKVIHVNKEEEGEYHIGFLIKKTSKEAVTATVNLVAGVADATQENLKSNAFFKEGNFTLTVNQDNGKINNISLKNVGFNFPGLVNDAKSKYTIVPFEDSVQFNEGDGSILVKLRSSVPFLFCKLAFTLQDPSDVKGNDKEIIVNAALGKLMTFGKMAELPPDDYQYSFMLFDKKIGYEVKDPFGKVKVSLKTNAAQFMPLMEPPNEPKYDGILDPGRSDATQLYKTNPDSITYFRWLIGSPQEVILATKGAKVYSYVHVGPDVLTNMVNCIDIPLIKGARYLRSYIDIVAIDALNKLQTEEGLNRPIDSMCYYFGDLLIFQGSDCTQLTINEGYFKQFDNPIYHSKKRNDLGYVQLLTSKGNARTKKIIELFPAIEGDENFKDGVSSAVYLGEYVKGKNKELDKLISENILSGNPADGSGVFMFFKDKYIHVLVQEKKEKNPLSISVWKACTIKSKLNISS